MTAWRDVPPGSLVDLTEADAARMHLHRRTAVRWPSPIDGMDGCFTPGMRGGPIWTWASSVVMPPEVDVLASGLTAEQCVEVARLDDDRRRAWAARRDARCRDDSSEYGPVYAGDATHPGRGGCLSMGGRDDG